MSAGLPIILCLMLPFPGDMVTWSDRSFAHYLSNEHNLRRTFTAIARNCVFVHTIMACLHVTLSSIPGTDLILLQSIFMVTKLDSGEAPWTAVKEMVTSDKTVQSKLPRHLWSMMPAIEEMAAAEGDTVGKASRAQSQQQPESADQAQIAS